VIVDPAGYIITNAHVVGSGRRLDVLLPQLPTDHPAASILKPIGKLVPATVLGLDREADIAVLKIDAKGLPALSFADSEQLRQGNVVFAFGSPFGLENSVTMGVVSSVARQVRPDDPMIYIQTDASINPGNSGGPLIDADGNVVGVNTFIVSQTSAGNAVGFAVPSNIAQTVYQQIREHGRVRRGQIGVQLQTITPRLAQALGLQRDWGVLIADVTPGSAADRGGLQIKDVVLTMNGRPMENARQFGVNIYQSAGKTITVEILRGGEKRSLEIAVLERPRDPDRILTQVTGEKNLVPKLGILAVDLNEQVTPLLPSLRRLAGVVVAGVTSEIDGQSDSFSTGDVIYAVNNTPVRMLDDLKSAMAAIKTRQPVAIQVERLGQLQFLVFDIE
jgi:serine protease Do